MFKNQTPSAAESDEKEGVFSLHLEKQEEKSLNRLIKAACSAIELSTTNYLRLEFHFFLNPCTCEQNSVDEMQSVSLLTSLFSVQLYAGGPDNGQHGTPPPGASPGSLPEPHHPTGNPAHAPRLPA